jgi:threonine/homoserine/homoserine lactone efflux protein
MSILSPEILAALAAFALASVWTPGPNNVMLAASGATFGVRRTTRQALGVALGFPLMLFAIALGLGEVLRTVPALRDGLAWVGFAVMVWLAWRIGTQGRAARADGRASEPLSFTVAVLFQWVNPKAWVMAVATAATYASGAAPGLEAAVAALVFALAGLTSAFGWAAAGAALGRLLGEGWRLRAFNAAMGALLALSALWLVAGP